MNDEPTTKHEHDAVRLARCYNDDVKKLTGPKGQKKKNNNNIYILVWVCIVISIVIFVYGYFFNFLHEEHLKNKDPYAKFEGAQKCRAMIVDCCFSEDKHKDFIKCLNDEWDKKCK